jgi:hypothetical protein
MPTTSKPKRYEVNWIDETSNSDAYFEVKCNGEILRGFPTREKADKYVEELRHTIVLRTKKINSYFRGVIIHCDKFIVVCQSYSGGGNPPLLEVLDYNTFTEEEMIQLLSNFAKKHNLILERD